MIDISIIFTNAFPK